MTEAELERRALEIMERPYHRMVHGDAAEGYLAEVVEFPGCLTDGNTAAEALENLNEAMTAWLMSVLDHGDPVPEPLPEHGGLKPLLLPESLHRRLVRHAQATGVGVDALATSLLADALSSFQLR
jgi:antitoxin HicB